MPEAVSGRCAKAHEHIFLFTKNKDYLYNEKEIMQPTVDGLELKHMKDVWTINTAQSPDSHFAVFPSKIPELCIKAGSNKGDIVLDPFMGSGTTALVAQKLSRKWIGIELNESYAEIIIRQTAQGELF